MLFKMYKKQVCLFKQGNMINNNANETENKNRSQSYDINRPRPRYAHKYTKYKICLSK